MGLVVTIKGVTEDGEAVEIPVETTWADEAEKDKAIAAAKEAARGPDGKVDRTLFTREVFGALMAAGGLE